MSIYFGEWPWKEVQLVSSSEKTAGIWQKGLQSITDYLKQVPSSQQTETSTVDHWLKCMYMELRQQNDGNLHAVTAFRNFAGLRLWMAYKVGMTQHYNCA